MVDENTKLPSATRNEIANLIEELERRFPKGSFLVPFTGNRFHSTVKENAIKPLYKALLIDSLNSLRSAYRGLTHIRYSDDWGTDYSFLKDIGARIQIIYLEAIHRLENNGAPFPPS